MMHIISYPKTWCLFYRREIDFNLINNLLEFKSSNEQGKRYAFYSKFKFFPVENAEICHQIPKLMQFTVWSIEIP